VLGVVDGQGQLDAIDQYCTVPSNPTGAPFTFTFGTITAGGTATLGFYEGYTFFGGAPATKVTQFSLTGMPASTLGGGTPVCYLFTVVFAELLAFRDTVYHQGIGYSWTFEDVVPGGVLGATFPFLACQNSCSNVLGVVDGQGQLDAIDQYCTVPSNPTGAPFTFTFGTITAGGTVTGTFTSMMMQIQEATDLVATTSSYNATTTPNTDVLFATRAIVGQPWNVGYTRQPNTVAGNLTVRVRRNRSLPNGTTPPVPVTGRVLISGPLLATYSGTHNGISGALVEPKIPLSFGLLCVHWAAQAQGGGGGIRLSSAVDGTIGTF